MRTIAFFSYARHDDTASNGLLSRIRAKLETEIQSFTGDEELEVFQDTDDIKPGEDWDQKLREALDESAFFIPVLTPFFFTRAACRREIDLWLANYRSPEERKRIIPVRFIPLMKTQGDGSPDDPLRAQLGRLQHVDFESHRGNANVRGKLGTAISDLARQIASML